MKKFLFAIALSIAVISCNNPDQNSAAGNEADVRDSSSRNNPNTNVDDSMHNEISSDTTHH